jgi:LacI family sucrose operon transcriptional repressor
MASIKEVAKKAGVGVGTVSRFLNNSGYVSEDTRLRVDRAVRELEYTPNQMARNLSRLSNGMVGIIIPRLDHPFYGEFLNNIELELYFKHYKVVVCNSLSKSDREQDFLEMLKRNAVDGIIVHSNSVSLNIEEYIKARKPIVTLDVKLNEDIPMVHVDHGKGGRMAARKLLDCGCKHIAQFITKGIYPSPVTDRYTEFARCVEEGGQKVFNMPLNHSSYNDNANRLFNEYPEVDGIFGVDFAACAALRVAYQRRIKVPENLKIIAYDGTYITDMMPQSITAIVQPMQELARHIVSTIVNLIEHKPVSRNDIMLDVYLREGDTT